MRQRLDVKADALRELIMELVLRLLVRTDAPITTHMCFVGLDIARS